MHSSALLGTTTVLVRKHVSNLDVAAFWVYIICDSLAWAASHSQDLLVMLSINFWLAAAAGKVTSSCLPHEHGSIRGSSTLRWIYSY
jgi:hypothetical protein